MNGIQKNFLTVAMIFSLIFLVDTLISQAAAETDLGRAVLSGEIAEVRVSLEKGANVNEKDSQFGTTPLHMAAFYGRTEIAKLLLRSKADINAVDNEGETPLLAALANNQKEMGELLINRGAKVNVMTKKGWTPLHFAVSLKDEDLVRLLVEKGADLGAKTSEGSTPLDLAITAGHKEIEAFLKKP